MSDILSREEFAGYLADCRSPEYRTAWIKLDSHATALAKEIQRLTEELRVAKQDILLLDAAYASFAGLLGLSTDASRDDIETALATALKERNEARDMVRWVRDAATKAIAETAPGLGPYGDSAGDDCNPLKAWHGLYVWMSEEIRALRAQLQEARELAAEQQRLRIAAAIQFDARLQEAERDTKRLNRVLSDMRDGVEDGEGDHVLLRKPMNGHGWRYHRPGRFAFEGATPREAIDNAMGAQEEK